MNRQIQYALCFSLIFLLTACLRDTVTEYENCVPQVSLVSAESTPSIEIIKSSSAWSDFKIGPEDYYICISSVVSCSSPASNITLDFTALPLGTEIILDGYVAKYNKIAVGTALHLRGKIESRTVWITYRRAQRLSAPINENSLKLLGMLDEDGLRVDQSSWECPNTK